MDGAEEYGTSSRVERLLRHQQRILDQRPEFSSLAAVGAAASSEQTPNAHIRPPKRVQLPPVLLGGQHDQQAVVARTVEQTLGMKPRPFPTPRSAAQVKRDEEDAAQRLTPRGVNLPLTLQRLAAMEAVDGGAPNDTSRFHCSPRGMPVGPVLRSSVPPMLSVAARRRKSPRRLRRPETSVSRSIDDDAAEAQRQLASLQRLDQVIEREVGPGSPVRPRPPTREQPAAGTASPSSCRRMRTSSGKRNNTPTTDIADVNSMQHGTVADGTGDDDDDDPVVDVNDFNDQEIPAFLPLKDFDVATDELRSEAEIKIIRSAAEHDGKLLDPVLARSRYYSSDMKFVWRECRVLEYDHDTGLYTIQWIGVDNKRKKVSRFNLQLHSEDSRTVQHRKLLAEMLRATTEQAVRTNHFLDALPMPDILLMDKRAIDRILMRAVAAGTYTVPARVIDDLVEETQDVYAKAQKVSTVQHYMTKPEFRRAYEKLALPSLTSHTERTVGIKVSDAIAPCFFQHRQTISTTWLRASAPVAMCVGEVYRLCQQVRDDVLMVVPRIPGILSLDGFVNQQSSERVDAVGGMRMSWPEAVISAIKQHLQIDVERSPPSIALISKAGSRAMDPDRATRLLRLVSLVMTDVLRDVTEASLAHFRTMFGKMQHRSLTGTEDSDSEGAAAAEQVSGDGTAALATVSGDVPAPAAADAVDPVLAARMALSRATKLQPDDQPTLRHYDIKPLFHVQVVLRTRDDERLDRARDVAADTSVHKPADSDGEAGAEAADAATGDAAATEGQTVSDAGSIASSQDGELYTESEQLQPQILFEPPLCEYRECLLNTFDDVIDGITGMPRIGTNYARDVGTGRPFLDVLTARDEPIATTRAFVDKVMRESFVAPEALRSALCEYLPIVQLYNGHKYWIDFAATRPTLAQFRQEIEQHLAAAQAAQSDIPDTLVSGLFELDLRPLKERIIDICHGLANGVLHILWNEAKTSSDALRKGFQAMSIKLKESPLTPEAWSETMEYVRRLPEEVDSKQQQIRDMIDKYELLEHFRFDISNHEFRLKWEAFSWPKQVALSITKSIIALRQAEQVFRDQLLKEKREFEARVRRLQADLEKTATFADASMSEEYLVFVQQLAAELKECRDTASRYSVHEGLFGVQPSGYGDVGDSVQQIEPFVTLWTVANNWGRWSNDWSYGEFTRIDPDTVEKRINKSLATLKEISAVLDGNSAPMGVVEEIRQEITEFQVHLPLIKSLRNVGLRDRHWSALAKVMGVNIKPDYDTTLAGMVQQFNFEPHLDEVHEISHVATEEFKMEQALDKMQTDWTDMEFTVQEQRDAQTAILVNTSDVTQLMEDQLVRVQNMKSSPFITPFLDRVNRWEGRLSRLSDILDEWMCLQRQWQYLEPIFRSGDIFEQIPAEGRRFTAVDRKWRDIMTAVRKNPKVLAFTALPKLLEGFRDGKRILESVTKGLNDYLDSKRSLIPRFYFLSNNELLAILSKSGNPSAVQPYLRNFFGGIDRLITSHSAGNTNAPPNITGMASASDEVVSFVNPVAASGRVEQWMPRVEEEMKQTIRTLLKKALASAGSATWEKWILHWPQQIAGVVRQILWTREVHGTLTLSSNTDRDPMLLPIMRTVSSEVTRLGKMLHEQRGQARSTLTSLLLATIHHRDVLHNLIAKRVRTVDAMEWISQLRYHWDPDTSTCTVHQMLSSVPYGDEYVGNAKRLVMIPSTLRTVECLLDAVSNGYGGQLMGGHAAGKTATVADLAHALAMHSIVFNCNDSVGHSVVANLLKGAISAGSWVCLSNFDRITSNALSIVAQQVLTIHLATLQRQPTFTFDGSELSTSKRFALFITTAASPVTDRNILPENLKMLFRPVAVVPPDALTVAEAVLQSEGFTVYRDVALRAVRLCELARDQLQGSKAHTYQFGLRTLRKALDVAAAVRAMQARKSMLLASKRARDGKQTSAAAAATDTTSRADMPDAADASDAASTGTVSAAAASTSELPVSEQAERQMCAAAMRQAMRSQLSSEDEPLFDHLLDTVFGTKFSSNLLGQEEQDPNSVVSDQDKQETLMGQVMELMEQRSLEMNGPSIGKIVQLHASLATNPGVLVVGPSGSGKSTTIQVLSEALTRLAKRFPGEFRTVKLVWLHPYALCNGQLFGARKSDSDEWYEGILSKLVRSRAVSVAESGVDTWIVLDGPMYARWMDILSTCVSTSGTGRALCLGNGERIILPPTVKFIFEGTNFTNASPSIASCCGSVFMEGTEVWESVLARWLGQLSDAFLAKIGDAGIMYLQQLFRTVVPPLLQLARDHSANDPGLGTLNMMRSLTGMLRPLFDAYTELDYTSEDGEYEIPATTTSLAGIMFFCVTWAVGGTLAQAGRAKFDTLLRSLMERAAPQLSYPSSGDVFSYYWDMKRCAAVPWLRDGTGTQTGQVAQKTIERVASATSSLVTGFPRQGSSRGLVSVATGNAGASTAKLLRSGSGQIGGDAGTADQTSAGMELVPTTRSSAMLYVLRMMLTSANQSLLLIGPRGSGKTTILSQLMHALPPSEWQSMWLSVTSYTTASYVRDAIEARLMRRRKGIYGPPIGVRLVVMLDDMHTLTAEEEDGPLELVRQYLDQGGWYDATNTWKEVENIVFVATSRVIATHSHYQSRLINQFCVMYVDHIALQDKVDIFSTLLSRSLKPSVSAGVRRLVPRITQATVALADETAKQLVPTWQKPHYVFSTQDVWRVAEGLEMGIVADEMFQDVDFIRLWYHECRRVFGDRLCTDEDRATMETMLEQVMQQHLDVAPADIVPSTNKQPLVFADTVISAEDADADADDTGVGKASATTITTAGDASRRRPYTWIKDVPDLARQLEEFIQAYNATHTYGLNVFMFNDAVEYFCRIQRILRQPCGHALLLGVGGTSRRSLVRFVAAVEKYSLVQLGSSRSYSFTDWRNDMRKVLKACGLDGRKLAFLIHDMHIADDAILADINGLLSAAELPDLWAQDDLELIYGLMRPLAKRMGCGESRQAVYDVFNRRVRANLHFVICMNPTHPMFKTRLHQFPSLLKSCTTCWFDDWSDNELVAVQERLMCSVVRRVPGGSKTVARIAAAAAQMHRLSAKTAAAIAARSDGTARVHVTQTHFLALYRHFTAMLDQRRDKLQSELRSMSIGLDKILTAGEIIDTMQSRIALLLPQITQVQNEVAHLEAQLDKEASAAGETKFVLTKEQEALAVINRDVAKLRNEASLDVETAIPALEQATNALRGISKKDISDIRGMARPHPRVVLVMEAVCILKDITPRRVISDAGETQVDYWPEVKIMLNDPKFIRILTIYDRDNVPASAIERLQPYMDNEDFRPEGLAKIHKAIKHLCVWMRALVNYHNSIQDTHPVRVKLERAELEQEEKSVVVQAVQEQVVEIEERMASLQADLDAANDVGRTLRSQHEHAVAQLEGARRLCQALDDERERWSAQIQQYEAYLENIVGDVLISAGMVAYLGPFTALARADVLQQWRGALAKHGISYTSDFQLAQMYCTPQQLHAWHVNALPRDSHCADNAVIMQLSEQFALLIDPDDVGNAWIRREEESNNLAVCEATNPDMLALLETCVRDGRPALIENIDSDVNPLLEPLLLRNTYNQAGRIMLRFNNKSIEYKSGFRLYMTTRKRDPVFTAALASKVTVVNFSMTVGGLATLLLPIIVGKEKPQLEDASLKLWTDAAAVQESFRTMELAIIELLSKSKANILDDDESLAALAAAKTTVKEWVKKREENQEQSAMVNQQRDLFVIVARRAAAVIECVSRLGAVNPLYQYSLASLVSSMLQGVADAPLADDFERRLTSLCQSVTLSIFRSVARSLEDAHRLVFAVAVTLMIDRPGRKWNASPGEIDLLVSGVGGVYQHGDTLLRLLNEKQRIKWRTMASARSDSQVIADAESAAADAAEGDGASSRRSSRASSASSSSQKRPSWLAPALWDGVVQLGSVVDGLQGIQDSIAADADGEWQAWVSASDVHASPLPRDWEYRANAWHRVLIHRVLRPTDAIVALQQFVQRELGSEFVQPASIPLSRLHSMSVPLSPLLFILGPGVDSLTDLYKLADQLGFSRKLVLFSLGESQAQGNKVREAVLEAIDRGKWVVLQNCHMSLRWLPQLERILDSTPAGRVHNDFRLWLTSMPTPDFPTNLLKKCIKLHLSPSSGIRASLLRSYDVFKAQLEPSKRVEQYKNMLYGLFLFNALIRQRNRFGIMGWSRPGYVFSDADLRACVRHLNALLRGLEDTDRFPYPALKHLFACVNFGGHVADAMDQRLLELLVTQCCSAEVQQEGAALTASPIYTVPPVGNLRKYTTALQELPVADDVRAHGVHPAAARHGDMAQLRQMISALSVALNGAQMLQSSVSTRNGSTMQLGAPASASGGSLHLASAASTSAAAAAATPDAHVTDEALIHVTLARRCSVLQSLLPTIDAFSNAVKAVSDITGYDECQHVLVREVQLYQQLLHTVHKTLQRMQACLSGTVRLTDTLSEVSHDLLAGRVPQEWASRSHASAPQLSVWFPGLVDRLQHVASWALAASLPPLVPLGLMFRPRMLLSAMLVAHARRHDVSVAYLEWQASILSDTEASAAISKAQVPSDGVYVTGAWMQGACFADGTITRSSSECNAVRVIHLRPVKAASASQQQQQQYYAHAGDVPVYECPVYLTPQRSECEDNLLMKLRLPCTSITPGECMALGVALLLQRPSSDS